VERLRHLVVIVPGILGSVLEDPAGRQVWGPGLWQVGGSLRRPSRLSVAENPMLVPAGLVPTISVVPPVWRLPGYDGLIRLVRDCFADVVVDTARPDRDPVPNADVLEVPYDFRLGVTAAAEYVRDQVEKRLGPLQASARRRRLIVIAHSMGGLVARHWLGPGGGASDCAALVTVGTPHGGAPKALDVLVNGVRLGPKVFRGLTALAREWRSVYDLLPRYPAIAAQNGGDPLYPHDLDVMSRLGIGAQVRAAYQTHADIDTEWKALTERPEVTAVFSRGHRTPLRASLDPGDGALSTNGVLSVTKETAEWLPNPTWTGDGTVPADSAIPNDLPDRRSWRPVTQRHLPMAATPAILDVLRNYAGATTHALRGDRPDGPWLGLDLEETYPANEPVTLSAELLGAVADEQTGVWVTVLARHGDTRHRVPADRHGDTWVATVPGLAPGTYEVRVDAVAVPGADQVRCTDVIGVVDP